MGPYSLIALQTLLLSCFLCVVFVYCDEIEKRDVHRIILKGIRRPRSYKGHRHYHGHHHHKSHSHNPRGREQSFEDLYDSHSSESGHSYHGKNRSKGRSPKYQRDSREKHRDQSFELYNDAYKEQSKSNENSFEDFHKGQSFYKQLNNKRPHFPSLPSHSLEFDETRPQVHHNEWTPVQYSENNKHPSFHSETQPTRKRKKSKSKRPKSAHFKGSTFLELTTAFPQKVPFLVYDNTEFPFVDGSVNREFNSKNIELVNAPVLNLDTIKTLTQQKTVPTQKRTSYQVIENPVNEASEKNHHQYKILVPDFAQSHFRASESVINEQHVEPETTTEKVKTTRRSGRGRVRTRSQSKRHET